MERIVEDLIAKVAEARGKARVADAALREANDAAASAHDELTEAQRQLRSVVDAKVDKLDPPPIP